MGTPFSPRVLPSALSGVLLLGSFALARADLDDDARAYEIDARRLSTVPASATLQPPAASRNDWQRFVSSHAGWTARWDRSLGTPVRSSGPAIPLSNRPGTPEAAASAAREFLARETGAWVNGDELTLLRASRDRNGWWVQYTQSYRGLRVVGGRAFTRISGAGLSLFGLQLYPGIDVDVTPTLGASEAVEHARSGFPAGAGGSVRSTELVVFPMGSAPEGAYRMAYEIEFTTADPFGAWVAYVDAVSGALLRRFSILHTLDVSGEVTGAIEPATVGDSLEVRPFPHAVVALADTGPVDSTVSAIDGSYLVTTPAGGPHTLTAALFGPFGQVMNFMAGGQTPSLEVSFDPDTTATVPLAFDDGNGRVQDRDAFYWAMATHDYIQNLDPGFTQLDYPMPIRVDFPVGECNAFWDGTGIAFLPAGAVCVDMARIASVVVHEYGHGITDFQYRPYYPPGDMHEGFSDYTAATLLDDPRIGIGFFGPGTVLRSVDNDLKVPDDLTGNSHSDGLIIAGALWNLRQEVGPGTADSLWHFARYGLSTNFDDYFFDVLVTDDDDGNVYNGTPHFDAIVNAFRRHGIGDYSIRVVHDPIHDTENPAQTFTMAATFLSVFAIDDASVQVHLVIDQGGGPVEETRPLTPTGGVREYSTVLEAQPLDTVVSYWLTAQDTAGTNVSFPEAGADGPLTFRIGTDVTPPVIEHTPLRDQPVDAARIYLRAGVTDNLDKGVDSVRVIYARGNDSETTATFTSLGEHRYLVTLSTAGNQVGDPFRYRIQVADSAMVPNSAVFPDTGWSRFDIVRGLGRDFEDDDGGLAAGEGWEWGDPEPFVHAYSGTNVWGTNLAGAYTDNLDTELILGPVDLAGFTSAGLTFQQIYDMETDVDGGTVYASADSGKTWNLLLPDGDYPYQDLLATGEPGFSGQSLEWSQAAFPLDAYLGASSLMIKLRLVSDESQSGLGWYVDDLELVERQVLSHPVSLLAESGRDGVVPLAWTAPIGIDPNAPDTPFLGYHVYRGFPGDPLERLTVNPVPGPTYVDATVTNGLSYRYAVRALYTDGESEPSPEADALPYRASVQASLAALAAASMAGEPADTTLHVANDGTGYLRANLWPVESGRSIDDARLRVPMQIDPFASTAVLPPNGSDAPAFAPPGVWTTVYVDPEDQTANNAVPDLDTLQVQLTGDSFYLRITGYRSWGSPTNGFTLAVGFDVDLDPLTNPTGEFVLLLGAAALQGYGNQAILLNKLGQPAGPVHHLAFPAGNVMELGVFLGSMGFPVQAFLRITSETASRNSVLDTVPDAQPLPWVSLDAARLELFQGTGQDVGIHLAALSDPGTYLGNLLLETNDPGNPVLTIPLTYTVNPSTPVNLLAFQGESLDLGVRLTWETSDETDHLGFRVFRSEAPEGTEREVTPDLLTGEHGSYAFADLDVVDGQEYRYRIGAVSRSGGIDFYGPLQVRYDGVSGLKSPVLRLTMPNPMLDRATIRFGLPEAAPVTLRVFAVDGRLVRVLADRVPYARGFHEVVWDGRDEGGRQVGAGVFPFRLEAGGTVRRGKITVVR